MDGSATKIHSFFARCLYMFLLDGTMKAYGVILEATVASYQTNHALIGPIFTLQTSVGYFIAPVVRLLEDSISPRLVAVLGGILVTAGFLCRALITDLSLWYLLMFMTISGVGFGLVNFVTYISLKEAFGNEFSQVYTLTAFSTYIGVAALPPLLGYLIRVYGERGGLFAFGLLASSLIISGIFTSPSQKSSSDSPQEEPSVDSDETQNLVPEAVNCDNEADYAGSSSSHKYWFSLFTRHPPFLFLTLVSVITTYEYISWSIYLVPFGENLGLDSTRVVYLSTAGGISGVLGKAFGLVILRWEDLVLPLGLIMPSILLGIAYGISLLLEEFGVLIFVASLSGFSLSLGSCVCSAWLPNTICAHHFKGAVTMGYFVSGVPTILGGFITGLSVDITGYYRPAFAMLGVISFVGTGVSVIWSVFFEKSHKEN